MKKPKKFPVSITILGRKYKIKQGKNLAYLGQPCLGLCDNENKIIYLEKNQSDHVKKETLIHEVAHAFMFISGIDQKLSDSECEMYAQLLTALYADVESSVGFL
jgi:Zn-dependent peptidase ImmA (M78 family)